MIFDCMMFKCENSFIVFSELTNAVRKDMLADNVYTLCGKKLVDIGLLFSFVIEFLAMPLCFMI